ncbi:DUF3618 domain-containing protein [Tessaracoccus oleiagri]|uniref:DUF3618 domain-containing protein n=1 Tax=Tessaracoccus oleiagri TaxID=686624 RepID=UPI000B850DE2|nr:DUF3618 domain-containing protein [Tessaracoccus oleiagri]
MAKERTVEDIRMEMAETRAKLRVSVADFSESIKPKNIAKKGVEEVKDFARSEFEDVKSQFVEADGSLRTKRVLAIAGAVVGVVAFAVTINALSGRRQLGARARKAITAS